MKKVCVIGGSRYFGRQVVDWLVASGAEVTVVNRGSSTPPAGVRHVVADRGDAAALAAALGPFSEAGDRRFDAVIDQVCYTPRQAEAAIRVFAGRTDRYVMTSTIEVYDVETVTAARAAASAPLTEDAVDAAAWPVQSDLPWEDDTFLEAHYGEGKRQAEAVFARSGAFPFLAVRSGHVLGGGPAEFTGRLGHYVERIAAGSEIDVYPVNQPSSFVHHLEIARALLHAAEVDATGAVNAASPDELDVFGLGRLVGTALAATPRYRTVEADASPFAFDRFYPMDTSRAASLGFDFAKTASWLPDAARESL